jgi:hypothetical protein
LTGRYRQLSGRATASLLLALLLLATTVFPALAWFDEGVAGQPARPCRVVTTGEGPGLKSCGQAKPRLSPRAALKQPAIHPAVARAEQVFEPDGQPAQVLAEY